MWKQEYKGCVITCDSNGMFSIVEGACKKLHHLPHAILHNLKARIDQELDVYYTITDGDFKKILNKLDGRESHIVHSLMEELLMHLNNAYCEMGISDAFPFNFTEDLLCSFQKFD